MVSQGFLSEESEQEESEFEDSDGGYKPKKNKKSQPSGGAIEPDESVVIPIGTKVSNQVNSLAKISMLTKWLGV